MLNETPPQKNKKKKKKKKKQINVLLLQHSMSLCNVKIALAQTHITTQAQYTSLQQAALSRFLLILRLLMVAVYSLYQRFQQATTPSLLLTR